MCQPTPSLRWLQRSAGALLGCWLWLVALSACSPSRAESIAGAALETSAAVDDSAAELTDAAETGPLDPKTDAAADVASLDQGDQLASLDSPGDLTATDELDTAADCMCGDNTCNPACGEDLATCSKDCASCGDGLCMPGESPISCPADCCGTCGDGLCKGSWCKELPDSCPADCNKPCGNSVCDKGENPSICPADCKPQVCGNGVCEPMDGGAAGCHADCATPCGNCKCEKGEDWTVCPQDCGYCGDGTCSSCGSLGESTATCPADCTGSCGSCDDAVACTVDYCGPGGSCVHLPSAASCADGNPCTLDKCGPAGCSNGPDPSACSDGNPCTDDGCDPVAGCAHTFNAAPCSDGNPCTSGDQCAKGNCAGVGACPDAVSDAGPDAAGGDGGDGGPDAGLDSGPEAGSCACGDGTCQPACGETTANCPGDCLACGDGVCAPGESPKDCFKDCCGNCGDGQCKGFACGEAPATCPADCGTACGNAVCDKGESPSLCPMDCKVGACGNGVCEAADGGPALCPQDCGLACGNCVCGKGESFVSCPVDCGWCGDTVCSPCAAMDETFLSCPADCGAPTCLGGCDDGTACTDDSCGSEGVCLHLPNSGKCNDSNPCTTDVCTGAGGCSHAFNASPCSDGDPCTSGDSCWQGACKGSGTCADAGASDGSAAADGAADADAADGAVADGGAADGDAAGGDAAVGLDADSIGKDGGDAADATCTATCGDGKCSCGETVFSCPGDCKACGDGQCSPGEGPKICPEDCCGGCGDGVCKGFTCGESVTTCKVDCGSSCGNKVCNPGESPGSCPEDCQVQVCGNGVCEPSDGGPGACPIDCGTACGDCICSKGEDWLTCPVDCGWCGDGICSNCPNMNEKNGGCAADCGSACPKGCDDGVACTKDECIGVATCAHLANNAACLDSNSCTIDACDKAKGCGHSPYSCDDGNSCTSDACDNSGGCTHAASGGPCDDGDACTLGDTCSGLSCKTVAKNCEDGTPCTKDACTAGACVNTGTCNLDLVFPFVIGLPGAATSFTFDGMAGQRISLDGPNKFSNCGLSVAVTATAGPVLSAGCIGGTAFVDVAVLPFSATYTLTLKAGSSETGSGTLYVHSVPPDPVAPVAVDKGPAKLATTVPCQNMLFTLEGAKGQRMAIQTTTSMGLCSVSVVLVDPTGKPVYSVGCAGGSSFSDLLVLPVAGTYKLHVNPGGTAIGSGEVTVTSVPQDITGTVAVDGPPVTLANSAAAQNIELTMQGKAGQRVALQTSTSFGLCSVAFAAKDPTGKQIYGNGCAGGSAYSDLIVLPADGTYTLRFDPGGTAVGSCEVAVATVPSDAKGVVAVDGGPVSLGNSGAGQNIELTMLGKAGQRVALSTTTSFSLCGVSFVVLDPTGKQIHAIGCAGGKAFSDLLVLPADGSYTLRFNPSGTALGTCEVAVASVPKDATGSVAVDGPPVTVANTAAAQNIELTLQGKAGQRVAILTSTNFGQCGVSFAVLDPAGKPIYANACAGGKAFSDLVVLPADGSYSLRYNPSGTAVGACETTVVTVPTNVSAEVVAGGAAVTVVSTAAAQNLVLTMQGKANQRVAIQTETSFAQCGVSFVVLDPAGKQVYASSCAGGKAFSDVIVLPVDGAYALVFNPADTAIGSCQVAVTIVPADLTGVLLLGGPAATAQFTAAGQNALLLLDITAGKGFKIQVESATSQCALYLAVKDPNGKQVAVNGCAGGSASVAVAVPALSGTYSVLLDPSGLTTPAVKVQAVGL